MGFQAKKGWSIAILKANMGFPPFFIKAAGFCPLAGTA